jgi:hypothetical protein
VIKARIIRLAEHIWWGERSHMVFVWEILGRLFGRPRHRLEDNIEIVLKEIPGECVD